MKHEEDPVMSVYMLITQDEFELPLAIADTAVKLAQMLGIEARAIYSAISHTKTRGTKSRFVKVKFEIMESEETE
jgi:hypothetical protein